MKIDGKQIASQILSDLKIRVEKLKEKNIIPHLYIILLSDDPQSASYVKQKMLRADEIGIKITLDKENPQVTTEELIKKIELLNNDESINGIIVQRPMPKQLNEEEIESSVTAVKDVDGFNPDSEFNVPVARAIEKIIINTLKDTDFKDFISSKRITVLGKGITAGKPIINYFKRLNENVFTIDSKTENRSQILNNSDIIISAVGKENVITKEDVKKGAYVIGVGLHVGTDGKLKGDFNEHEIEQSTAYFSPTPGGVGPVNVACLMENVVVATEKQNLW